MGVLRQDLGHDLRFAVVRVVRQLSDGRLEVDENPIARRPMLLMKEPLPGSAGIRYCLLAKGWTTRVSNLAPAKARLAGR